MHPSRCLLGPCLILAACSAPVAVDPCADAGADAPSTCVAATLPADHYVAESLAYFDTMDKRVPDAGFPDYTDQVVRWEWPPWLLLTGFGRDQMESGDILLRGFPSIVEDRDCRFFDEAPFGRCRITFYYDAHEGRSCPIYEEFSFDEQGRVSFVEAWSDQPGMLPMGDDDPWAEGEGVTRLSTRVPGLGSAGAALDPNSAAFAAAAAADPDVAELRLRMGDFFGNWSRALAAAGDEMWEDGCGW